MLVFTSAEPPIDIISVKGSVGRDARMHLRKRLGIVRFRRYICAFVDAVQGDFKPVDTLHFFLLTKFTRR
jgi:hypothetical protein